MVLVIGDTVIGGSHEYAFFGTKARTKSGAPL